MRCDTMPIQLVRLAEDQQLHIVGRRQSLPPVGTTVCGLDVPMHRLATAQTPSFNLEESELCPDCIGWAKGRRLRITALLNYAS